MDTSSDYKSTGDSCCNHVIENTQHTYRLICEDIDNQFLAEFSYHCITCSTIPIEIKNDKMGFDSTRYYYCGSCKQTIIRFWSTYMCENDSKSN